MGLKILHSADWHLDSPFRSLPEQNRKIFILRYWYLCSVGKIAQSLGLSESGVKMSLLRTRRQLKTMLQKEGIHL